MAKPVLLVTQPGFQEEAIVLKFWTLWRHSGASNYGEKSCGYRCPPTFSLVAESLFFRTSPGREQALPAAPFAGWYQEARRPPAASPLPPPGPHSILFSVWWRAPGSSREDKAPGRAGEQLKETLKTENRRDTTKGPAGTSLPMASENLEAPSSCLGVTSDPTFLLISLSNMKRTDSRYHQQKKNSPWIFLSLNIKNIAHCVTFCHGAFSKQKFRRTVPRLEEILHPVAFQRICSEVGEGQGWGGRASRLLFTAIAWLRITPDFLKILLIYYYIT